MPGTNNCFSLVRGRAMRVTRLDGCGAVDLGPDSSIVSDGFITVQLTAQTDAGQTISVTNAAGKVCILDEPCPVFTGYDLQIEFCGVNPALIELLTGQDSIYDAESNRIGFKMNSAIDACDSGFALEIWSNVPTAVCEPGAGVSYGYFLVPFAKGGVIGDFTVGNDAVNFSMTGAKTKDGSAWDVGPYDIINDETGTPGPLLMPVDPHDHLQMFLTTVAPPEPDCDPGPVGVAATGATAGTPGTYTPADSYGPADLAAAASVTASPVTAWASGEYIVLDDGTDAHWSGTAWVAGIAP